MHNKNHLRSQKTQNGSALVVTMIFLVAMAVALEAVHSYTTSTHFRTARTGGYFRQSAAAEAGIEIVAGRLIQWVIANGGSTPSIADCSTGGVPGNPSFPAINSAITIPSGCDLNDFVFSTPQIYPVLPDDSVVTSSSDPKYLTNLSARINIPETSATSPLRYYFTRNASQNARSVQARSLTYKITMTVSPKMRTLTSGRPLTLVRYVRCDKINPFTWASYRLGGGTYNTDTTYTGPLYLSGDAVINGPKFADNFLYGGNVTDISSTWLGAGKDAQLKQSSLLSLIPSVTSALVTDNTGVRQAGFETDTTSPGAGKTAPADAFSTRELIEPPTNPANDLTPTVIKNARIYNQADVRIKINVTTILGIKTVQKTVVNVDGTPVNPITNLWVVPLLAAVNTQALPDNSPLAFIDRSRSSTQAVQTTNINVGLMRIVMELFPSVFPTGTIYAWDATGLNGGTRPLTGIRLWNAGILPQGGLVVGSNDPIYLKGDFNTGTILPNNALIDDLPLIQPRANTMGTNGATTASDRVVTGYVVQPAGVFGDSLTELSNAWTDLLSRNTIPASSTTYNLVEGWSTMSANELQADDTFTDASGRATPIWIENWLGKRRTMSGEEFVCWHSLYGQNTTQVGGYWSGDVTYDSRVTALKLNWGTVSFTRDRLTRL